MKKLNVSRNVLTAGVALALGVSSTGIATASTDTGSVSPTGGVQIKNTATATYSVDGVKQPEVTSNGVIVNINEVGSFTLVATQGASQTDDKNENQVAVPGGTTLFTNTLKNTGSVADTYTITVVDGDEPAIPTTTKNYGFDLTTASPEISYVIKDANGVATTLAAGQTKAFGTIQNGKTISLLPGQYAELSYNLKTPESQVGGQNGVGTLTATSTYISAKDKSKATLVNENQAIVKLPVFSIVKSAANTSIDWNVTEPTIDYTITVTNDGRAAYAADAVGVLVQDKLPAGLTVKGDKVTASKGTASVIKTTTDGTQIVAVKGVDLKVGESMTVTFTAVVNKSVVDRTSPLVNNADVYDNYGNTPVEPGENPTSNTKDSTSTSDPNGSKTTDPNNPNEAGGDKSSTVVFTDRALSITLGETKELPPTSAADKPAQYTHTVTNNGNSPETGLTFTITDTKGDSITPSNVKYNGASLDPIKTVDNNGVTTYTYTIPETLDSKKSGTITYDVTSNNATSPSSDTNTITLVAAPKDGTTTPIINPVSNTTNVKGLTLEKTQALNADCDMKLNDTLSFSTADINGAKPNQCIVYKITATNNLTAKQLTNVVISDATSQWNTKATYEANSAKDSANGSVTTSDAAIQSSPLTLNAGQTGYLQFAIRINNGGSSAQ